MGSRPVVPDLPEGFNFDPELPEGFTLDEPSAPGQKAPNPLFAPLQGAKIEAQPPFWPYPGGPKSRLGSQVEGFFKELPAMALRGGNLLRNVAQGEDPWSPKAAAEGAALEERLNELLGTAKTGEKEARTGRLLARMDPGVVAGAATGGMSVPAGT